MGELSLDGRIKGVHGVLSAAFQAKDMDIRGVIVPRENASEAAMVKAIEVIPVETLSEVMEFLGGRKGSSRSMWISENFSAGVPRLSLRFQ